MRTHAIGPLVNGPQGYTPNHLKFDAESDRFQRQASGSVPAGTVTITVVLARPVTKGSRVVFMAIDPVHASGYNLFLPFDLCCRTSQSTSLSLQLLGLMIFVTSVFRQ